MAKAYDDGITIALHRNISVWSVDMQVLSVSGKRESWATSPWVYFRERKP
ncbi:hypothetical protein [Gloeocapsopsis dulcis]|nr:hypothetical protein [Gloeocapsopsis dulcis]WNN88292.1 hypothetical protein P0S91_18635 [Gloeocapsopsis dulcis]